MGISVDRVENEQHDEGTLELRFLSVNRDKLRRVHDTLTPRQSDLLEILPLIFHSNARSLPAYVADDTPLGIADFASSRKVLAAAARVAGSFKQSPAARGGQPDLLGLYLMGSPGTVGFSKSSDLDIWLVHRGDLDETALAALNLKARKLEKFAASLDLEMHFFVFDAASFRAGETLNLSAESSGSSQHYLLLDEFYRSGLLLAGLRPLWWRIRPEQEADYENIVAAELASGNISADEYVDFGALSQIPADEFLGVALWHLYKSIESPYKSLLKLLLMETYASEYPRGALLSHEYKSAISDQVPSINDVDPYIAMFRRVERYLHDSNDNARLALVRRSFYLKTNIRVSRSVSVNAPDWQIEAVDEIVKSWGWSVENIAHLDDRANWKIPAATQERRQLVKALGKSYAVLSNFAKSYTRDQKITQTDLNILGRKLYAAFERKPSKIDIVTRGVCPNPEEAALTLSADYASNTEVNWSLYSGALSPEALRDATPLAQARSPSELLAWCHFNRLNDQKTNWRIYDLKEKISLADIRKALETIETCYPGANIGSEDPNALALASRPLDCLLLINLGTNPLPAKIVQRGVLTSNRTDAFKFGGQGMNLVHSVDLIMMTSWEEVFVFSFQGQTALLDALVEYLQWGTPLGSIALASLKVSCFAKNHAHAIQRRVEAYANEVIDLLCQSDPHVDGQNITQFEKQFCRVFKKNKRPAYEFHRNLSSLTNALGTPQVKFNRIVIDAKCDDLGALPVIFARNKPGLIQLFIREDGNEADIFVLDEFGALFTQRQECFRLETLFDQYVQFLRNQLKHHIPRVDAASVADAVLQIETYRLKTLPTGSFETVRISAPMPRTDSYLPVRVFVDIHKGGNQQFTVYCEDEEFSSLTHGGHLFIEIAKYVLHRRGSSEKYPIFISDLELSARFKQQRNIDALQTIHVLNYKKRIEHQLTRALQVDLSDPTTATSV